MNNDCDDVGSGGFAENSYRQGIPKTASVKSVRVWCDGWLVLICFVLFRYDNKQISN